MTQELRDEARRREAEQAALARKREEFSRDIRELGGRAEGRRFFRWLIQQGDIFAEDYQPGAVGAYRAGLRTFALRIRRIFRELLPPEIFASVAEGAEEEREAESETAETPKENDFF